MTRRECKMGSVFASSRSKEAESEEEDEHFYECISYDEEATKEQADVMDVAGSSLNIDAVGKRSTSNLTAKKLTLEHVEDIECELDFYEKVSLVFLLYDNADVALQHLIVELKCQQVQSPGNKVLVEWAQSKLNQGDIWKKQLVEALCIIQNYAVLMKLGFNKTELSTDFLPTNAETSVYVSPLRKAMYRIFEDMNKNQVAQFLYHVRNDFDEKKIEFKEYRVDLLEMYVLHWFTVRYITFKDVSNVAKVLKVMEMENIGDMLKKVATRDPLTDDELCKLSELYTNFGTQKLSKNVTDNNVADKSFIVNASPEVEVDVKRIENVSSVRSRIHSDVECYSINPQSVGICVIINQKTFYREQLPEYQLLLPDTVLEDRLGTDKDKQALKGTFEKFGFDIVEYDDLDHIKIKEALEYVTRRLFKSKHSCLVVCILSHGKKDKVYGINSIPVDVGLEIEPILYGRNCPNLLRKPKVLIVQSCQGQSCQRVVTIDESNLTTDGVLASPEILDLVICWSTWPGFASIRDKEKGSWFIQTLCKWLVAESPRLHFMDIFQKVISELAEKRWRKSDGVTCMVPYTQGCLSKCLYLQPVSRQPSC